MRKGAFLVIEGPDGTGKTDQTTLLVERLKREGYDVETLSFPRYETPTGMRVREYLNGKLGAINDVSAQSASKLYADDRKAAAPEIRAWLDAGKMVVANRYVASNMAHQGTKMLTPSERRDFFAWNDALEYGTNNIPKPSANVILDVPLAVAMKRVDKRGNAKDIHEADPHHLRRAHEVYREIAELFPQHFWVVSGMDGGRELTQQEVHEHVWKTIKPHLP